MRAICETIAENLYKRGTFGFVSIDLVAFQEPMKSETLFWANGITCCFTDFNSSQAISEVLSSPTMTNSDSNEQHQDNLGPRFSITLPFISHQSLPTIYYKSFFHLTRLENLYFDIESKTGIVFILADSLQTGVIGILVLEDSVENCYATLLRGLNFLRKQGDNKQAKYWKKGHKQRNDTISFDDIYGRVKVDIKGLMLEQKINKTNFSI